VFVLVVVINILRLGLEFWRINLLEYLDLIFSLLLISCNLLLPLVIVILVIPVLLIVILLFHCWLILTSLNLIIVLLLSLV